MVPKTWRECLCLRCQRTGDTINRITVYIRVCVSNDVLWARIVHRIESISNKHALIFVSSFLPLETNIACEKMSSYSSPERFSLKSEKETCRLEFLYFADFPARQCQECGPRQKCVFFCVLRLLRKESVWRELRTRSSAWRVHVLVRPLHVAPFGMCWTYMYWLRCHIILQQLPLCVPFVCPLCTPFGTGWNTGQLGLRCYQPLCAHFTCPSPLYAGRDMTRWNRTRDILWVSCFSVSDLRPQPQPQPTRRP